MGAHFDRAIVLIEQSRHELAEEELRKELGENPNLAPAHALLGLCLLQRERYEEATESAEQAIHLQPDSPFGHYALARIFLERNRFKEADRAIQEAIRLDPQDADYHGVLASIRFSQNRWRDALQAAEAGLAIDAQHVGCTNLRAMALVQLGRRADAGATIGQALARDPENALTHANQGWTLMHQGDHRKALEHFRESLRIDPEQEWARQGIVEALKARHFFYRPILRFFLWMSRLTPGAQWGVIIGFVVLRRILQSVANNFPVLKPFITPLIIVYVIFVLMTWIGSPLFNLVLRLDRFGRLALSREQVVASNWIGGCLLAGLVALGVWFVTGNGLLLLVALGCGAIVIPLSGTFQCESGWPRRSMACFTVGLAAVGFSALAVMLMIPPPPAPDGSMSPGGILGGIFMVGAILSPWLANSLAMAQPRR